MKAQKNPLRKSQDQKNLLNPKPLAARKIEIKSVRSWMLFIHHVELFFEEIV